MPLDLGQVGRSLNARVYAEVAEEFVVDCFHERCAFAILTESGRGVRPDGFGRVDGSSDTCRFLLELDRGTERGQCLADKLEAYAWFGQVDPHAADAVLFLFPTHEREVQARNRMSAVPGLCVATSTRALFFRDSLGPVWLPRGRRPPCSILVAAARNPAPERNVSEAVTVALIAAVPPSVAVPSGE